MSIALVAISVPILICLVVGAVDDMVKKLKGPPPRKKRYRDDDGAYIDGFVTAVALDELHDMFEE